MSQKLRIKWNFELTVFELIVPDVYQPNPPIWKAMLKYNHFGDKHELLFDQLSKANSLENYENN